MGGCGSRGRVPVSPRRSRSHTRVLQPRGTRRARGEPPARCSAPFPGAFKQGTSHSSAPQPSRKTPAGKSFPSANFILVCQRAAGKRRCLLRGIHFWDVHACRAGSSHSLYKSQESQFLRRNKGICVSKSRLIEGMGDLGRAIKEE